MQYIGIAGFKWQFLHSITIENIKVSDEKPLQRVRSYNKTDVS